MNKKVIIAIIIGILVIGGGVGVYQYQAYQEQLAIEQAKKEAELKAFQKEYKEIKHIVELSLYENEESKTKVITNLAKYEPKTIEDLSKKAKFDVVAKEIKDKYETDKLWIAKALEELEQEKAKLENAESITVEQTEDLSATLQQVQEKKVQVAEQVAEQERIAEEQRQAEQRKAEQKKAQQQAQPTQTPPSEVLAQAPNQTWEYQVSPDGRTTAWVTEGRSQIEWCEVTDIDGNVIGKWNLITGERIAY